MKKYICMALAVVMVLSCAACGGGNSTASTTTTTATTTTTLTPTPALLFGYREVNGGIAINQYLGTDENVIIPETIDGKTVTEIDGYIFYFKQNLVSVVLPETITKIGDSAFYGCNKLAEIVLPKSLEGIGSNAFRNCTSLAEIVLPKSLEGIGSNAFQNCTSLKEIIIPGNCEMGLFAFSDSGLETVVFEEGVPNIPYCGFSNTNIQSISLPKTVEAVGWNAFGGCKNLETISLSEGLKTIESAAFYGTKITEIVIPSTVTEVFDYSFTQCSKLDRINFEGDAPEEFGVYVLSGDRAEAKDVHFTIYYHEGAAGFTSPEWFGYPTAIW
ncbi:MAG: leucine-rich repeat domain-containing protein [Clostridia bacterium]|nr:leucine-rich repeat domain-containing protein [Clostridia bacterium]